MTILDEHPALLDAFRGEMTPKFLATRSPDGVPNVVPVVSLQPADDQPDIVFFGNFLLRKTIRNLEQDPRVGILVITPSLRGWILTGDFLEFQRSGPYVERQMSGSLLRYNAYTGIRNAGVIRLRSISGEFTIPRLKVLFDFLLGRLAGLGSRAGKSPGIEVPLATRREFGRMTAVKVLAWIGEHGYPTVVPCLSLQPSGHRALAGWRAPHGLPMPPAGARASANLLTLGAVSYQAKGRWTGGRLAGSLQVEEVYAGGPPLPGGRVA